MLFQVKGRDSLGLFGSKAQGQTETIYGLSLHWITNGSKNPVLIFKSIISSYSAFVVIRNIGYLEQANCRDVSTLVEQ
jgi:hypothetical protein